MRKSSIILVATLAAYGIGIAVTFCLTKDWTARQTAAVVLTGAVVIWYTWETMRLRQMSLAQRELQLRPFVVFKGTAQGYFVENLGTAPALGVTIERIQMSGDGVSLSISFPASLPLLRSLATEPIATEVVVNGKKVDGVFAAHLDPNYAIADVDVRIRFRSIEGKQYELVQTTSPKTMEIKGFRETDA